MLRILKLCSCTVNNYRVGIKGGGIYLNLNNQNVSELRDVVVRPPVIRITVSMWVPRLKQIDMVLFQ